VGAATNLSSDLHLLSARNSGCFSGIGMHVKNDLYCTWDYCKCSREIDYLYCTFCLVGYCDLPIQLDYLAEFFADRITERNTRSFHYIGADIPTHCRPIFFYSQYTCKQSFIFHPAPFFQLAKGETRLWYMNINDSDLGNNCTYISTLLLLEKKDLPIPKVFIQLRK
jgi:hypothetical protein